MANDVTITITDREGISHEVQAPTDMNMNIMELVRAYELAPEGTIGICGGMAMCASCQCYVLNDFPLPEKVTMNKPCFGKLSTLKKIAAWVVKFTLRKTLTDSNWSWLLKFN